MSSYARLRLTPIAAAASMGLKKEFLVHDASGCWEFTVKHVAGNWLPDGRSPSVLGHYQVVLYGRLKR